MMILVMIIIIVIIIAIMIMMIKIIAYGLWSTVSVWSWIFENFFEDSCDVCKRKSVWNCSYYISNIALPISFPQLLFFSKFWCKVFTIIIRCLRI